MQLLLRWLVNAIGVLLVANLVPGVSVNGFWTAVLVALVLGILNAVVRPVLILLTLPITIVTLGLFTFVLNALLFWFAGSILKGFDVAGFWPAFWGALVLWLFSWSTNVLLRE